MTYPHLQRAPGILLCECGALAGVGPTSIWGADCPVAMRAEIDRLTLDLDAARQRIAAIVPAHDLAASYGAGDDEAPDEWAARIVRERVEARADVHVLRYLIDTDNHAVGSLLSWAPVGVAPESVRDSIHRLAADGLVVRHWGADGLEHATFVGSRWAARVRDERIAHIAERDTARRTLSTLDCRYPGGAVADLTGSHCPLGAPCERCQRDARIEELERQLDAATAIVHITTGSRDDR